MNRNHIPVITEDELSALVSWPDAVAVLEHALLEGSAPGRTPLRSAVDVSSGQLLIMPSEVGAEVGVKLVSVSPGNGSRGLPRIQGVHLVLDGPTLSPVALVDAVGLTLLRTAAVSAVAARHLSEPSAHRLVVFGTGPQAWSHVRALSAVRPVREVTVVGRTPHRITALVETCRQAGFEAHAGTPGSVAGADIVACCTSASTPLFDSRLLPDHATVIAMGSHFPDAREVDAALVRRAAVVVESRASAFEEAGDILLAVADGVPVEAAVDGELGELVRGEFSPAHAGPRLFKSVGEAWSDVVVAGAAVSRLREQLADTPENVAT
ncbi:MAG TPA: ornithine cyclodeaminase [Streptomyces sp.]|nr:ornithine cyclodeaminase [Streptomyces sp.]